MNEVLFLEKVVTFCPLDGEAVAGFEFEEVIEHYEPIEDEL